MTAVVYEQAKKIAVALSLPMTLHHTLTFPLGKMKSYDSLKYEGDHGPPELLLAAVVIIVLKMYYGYDNIRRYARM